MPSVNWSAERKKDHKRANRSGLSTGSHGTLPRSVTMLNHLGGKDSRLVSSSLRSLCSHHR